MSKMSDKIQTAKEPGVCVETGHGRSADPSPQKQQYSSSNVRKQQNKSKGSYGSSRGRFCCVHVSETFGWIRVRGKGYTWVDSNYGCVWSMCNILYIIQVLLLDMRIILDPY